MQKTAGRWEDGRWVESERLAEEPDEPVVEPVAEETGDKELIPVLWERSAYAVLLFRRADHASLGPGRPRCPPRREPARVFSHGRYSTETGMSITR